MPNLSQLLPHAAIYVTLGTLALLAVVLRSPRLMLQDFPKSIHDAVPPKTEAEKRLSVRWGLPFILILLCYPFLATFLFKSQSAEPPGFASLFLFAFGIAFAFNLWDLLVLDWLLLCTITPSWAIVPGTEGNPGSKDYAFHFRGFLIGSLLSAAIAVIVAAVVGFL